MPVEAMLWICAFAAIMAATCWRAVAQLARGRRCTEPVQGVYAGAQDGSWTHGDSGDEGTVSRPIYRYEYAGASHVSAAGVSTLLFDRSPAGKRSGEPVELRVNPDNPAEVYDPAYERWFAKYRIIWGLTGCAGCFVLVSLLW